MKMNYFQRKIYCEINFLSLFYQKTHFMKNSALSKQDIGNKIVSDSIEQLTITEDLSLIVLDGDFNYSTDIATELSSIRQKIKRQDRVMVIGYNSYFNWLYRLLSIIGLRSKTNPPHNTLTKASFHSIVRIADFEITKSKSLVYFPFSLFFIGDILNSFLSLFPFLSNFSICQAFTLRPINYPKQDLSLSIIVPIRNEAGTIQKIFDELNLLEIDQLEVIFVEGNSTDDSWDLLCKVVKENPRKLKCQVLQQSGKGKEDAVTMGINQATGELLTILDADLTVSVDKVAVFHHLICTGKADLINGNRLYYVFENKAMRFFNWMGNLFFAKFLGYIFEANISDSLCGTKLFYKRDYLRFLKWNSTLKIIDPFGDFKLLMPTLDLGLGIIDVPVYYRSRVYGETNIHRFRDGCLLLKIALKAFAKRKML